MYRKWKAHDFYVLCFFVLFFIRSLWHWGLHAPQRRTYLRKTDFCTQRVENRKINSLISLNILALQVPPIFSLPISLVSLLKSNHTRPKGAQVVHMGRGVEPWTLAPVQNQPFLPEGKETQPFGLIPDIILYRNRTINIYI